MSDPAPRQVLVIRHAATEWSTAGRHTGRTDLPLTPAGEDEARRLGQWLGGVVANDALVLASPLRRATDTARIALPRTSFDTADALMEMDYGEFEGWTRGQIHDHTPGWSFVDGAPGGENLARVAARCDAMVAKLERVAAQRQVVLFTHGHTSRVLTCRLVGLPAAAAGSLHNDTASVAVIDARHGRLALTGWNLRP